MQPLNKHKIYILVHNQILSEAIQKIAFEYGFSWFVGGKVPNYFGYPYIVLNAETKELLYGATCSNSAQQYSVLNELHKILDWLENTKKMQYLKVADNNVAILRGGDVVFGSTTIKAADVKQIFDAWKE